MDVALASAETVETVLSRAAPTRISAPTIATTAPAPTSRCPECSAATYGIDPNRVADTGGGAQLVTVVDPSTAS